MIYQRTTRYITAIVDMGACCRIATSDTDQKKEEKLPKCIRPSQDVRSSARMIERGTITSLSNVIADQFGQFQGYKMNGSYPYHSHIAPA